jgi:predicted dehydrogenase
MIRAGVVGVGHIGCFHAEKYAQLPAVDLVGIYDRAPQRAMEIAARLKTTAYPSLDALLAHVDVVSIAVPAIQHFAVARTCLQHGVHVLLEKPMAVRVEDARQLVELARSAARVLQIGYLERFNPAVTELRSRIGIAPLVIARRAGPYARRGNDIDVVMDLMVHDIDVLFEIMGAPASVTAAGGTSVLSGKIDVASVTLQFANGSTACLTADRVADQVARQMRFFEPDQRLEVDFTRQIVTSHRYRNTPADQPQWLTQTVEFPPTDALLLEVENFIDCVRTGRAPRVDGEQGLRTLAIARQIQDLLSTVPTPTDVHARLDAVG